MIKEHKELLLKDLSARYPYGVYFSVNGECHKLTSISIDLHCPNKHYWINGLYDISKVKPYLRSMESMTEEEYEEYSKLWNLQDEFPTDADIRFKTDVFDWLNAHHFDYRGLIEKGLAIEVAKENNPYKE